MVGSDPLPHLPDKVILIMHLFLRWRLYSFRRRKRCSSRLYIRRYKGISSRISRAQQEGALFLSRPSLRSAPGAFRLYRFRHFRSLDQLRFQQPAVHALKDRVVHVLLSLEAQFHLGGMDIDVDRLPVHMEMEDCKRKFMLHGKVFVCILQRF